MAIPEVDMAPRSESRSSVWKWIGCGCGGCLLLIVAVVAFVAAVGGLAFFGIRKSEPYSAALERARANPQVVEALGEPIEPGMLASGSINMEGSSGEASLSIPISGPEGAATIYVEGTKTAGRWEFSLMEVEIQATGERIDLLAEGENEQAVPVHSETAAGAPASAPLPA